MSTPPGPSRRGGRRAPVAVPDPEAPGRPPAGGAGREEAAGGRPPAAPRGDAQLRVELAECTADLQRLKAEYDNYRKRIQRDRLAVREIAVANVLRGLLPVLDAVAQARVHGEVTGGFASVVGVMEEQLAALGLQAFGDAGDPFDPVLHEAVAHTASDRVDRPTCTHVLRPGYRVGEHLLRPAQVEVAEPPAP